MKRFPFVAIRVASLIASSLLSALASIDLIALTPFAIDARLILWCCRTGSIPKHVDATPSRAMVWSALEIFDRSLKLKDRKSTLAGR